MNTLRLRARSTGISFDIEQGTPEQLAQWLEGRGFVRAPGNASAEHARCRNDRMLVVIYHTSALCQGDALGAAVLLHSLGEPGAAYVEQLDWTAGGSAV